MSIEYQITCKDFGSERFETIINKILSVVDEERVARSSEIIEIRITDDPSSMPDISIQRENDNQFIFLYNGGTMKSWAIFGLFISHLSTHSESITVEEL